MNANEGGRGSAIITGAGRGIGAAVAARLMRDGYDVALLDVDEAACAGQARLLSATGSQRKAIGVRCDVDSEDSVSTAVGRVADELGGPGVLVNNAGNTRDSMLFKMSLADWDSVLGVHLRGAFLLSRACQTYMVERNWGRIVNMSSKGALGVRGQTNYSAAKAGIQGFTKALALELGPYGVTVNAIAPGVIATEMTEDTATRLGMTFEEYRDNRAADIAVRRIGRPEDIAALVSFFCREEASFISGQIVYAAGGPVG